MESSEEKVVAVIMVGGPTKGKFWSFCVASVSYVELFISIFWNSRLIYVLC